MSDTAPGVRVDIWLWRARFFKTRAIATDYVSRKGVRITKNGLTRKTDKAGQRVGPGDVLTFYKAKAIETVEILEVGERRGPASEAQTLYRRLEPGA
ncbi:MAG: RNA-binding S4 domain-containing protein [Henriciella sp.]|jgi:ribosome-associated heat shock protein Hsp15